MTDMLIKQRCLPCEGGIPPLDADKVETLLKEVSGWETSEDNKILFRDFKFNDYYQTMAFVNAIAWMSHLENHHPDLEVGYNHCKVQYTTHAINGLSNNDFICAAKVEQLLEA